MNSTSKNECCQGCKKGQPGQNKACQAKLMVQALESQQKTNKIKAL